MQVPPRPMGGGARGGLPAIGIDDLARGDNILLVGNKGSGKSSLLANLIKRREGDTVVIDPHYAPGAWGGARVVGAGRDYQSVSIFLEDLEKSLAARYRQMAQGKRLFHQLTVCGDEWRSIAQRIDGAGATFASIITEGRKVRLCVLAASHSDTVASLGCKGDKDAFMNSFDWIVYLGSFATQRFPSAMDVPLIQTTNGAIPAYACAVNVNQQTAYVLDLRSTQPTSPDQSRPVQTSPDRQDQQLLATLLATSLPQSKAVDYQSRPVQTSPDPAAVRAKLSELGSKNKVAAWLHEEYGIASKGKAYAIIKQAE